MVITIIIHKCFPISVSPSWDIENPEIVSLPSFDPNIQNDVRCIAGVKDRVWIGAGPSIFFLSAENLQREVRKSTLHYVVPGVHNRREKREY